MLKEIKLEEVLQNLYEDKPVYMMLRIEKENAIEDLFGADGFYIEAEEPEQMPESGGGRTGRRNAAIYYGDSTEKTTGRKGNR